MDLVNAIILPKLEKPSLSHNKEFFFIVLDMNVKICT
jgi:hypothetical protein